MKKRPLGPARTVRTPENVVRVRGAFIRRPGRSAGQHARELQMKRQKNKVSSLKSN
ncbi:hypothetical protein C0J52_15588 [Blattella germanica]|nr:hypothetical protein C0J52_15588 [Blattella germanica]